MKLACLALILFIGICTSHPLQHSESGNLGDRLEKHYAELKTMADTVEEIKRGVDSDHQKIAELENQIREMLKEFGGDYLSGYDKFYHDDIGDNSSDDRDESTSDFYAEHEEKALMKSLEERHREEEVAGVDDMLKELDTLEQGQASPSENETSEHLGEEEGGRRYNDIDSREMGARQHESYEDELSEEEREAEEYVRQLMGES